MSALDDHDAAAEAARPGAFRIRAEDIRARLDNAQPSA